MSIWAPVVAALGASFLTGIIRFGGIWWQQRRLARAAVVQEKSVAYHLLIAHSLSFFYSGEHASQRHAVSVRTWRGC
jgi:hypothetical protein